MAVGSGVGVGAGSRVLQASDKVIRQAIIKAIGLGVNWGKGLILKPFPCGKRSVIYIHRLDPPGCK